MQPLPKLVTWTTTVLIIAPAAQVRATTNRMCNSHGWDITSAEAYTWNFKPPQSCSCQATGVALADCEIFDCECVCDMTASQCDVNCCCDTECTTAELERFQELGSCLDEGPADEVTTTCYSTDSLDKINPRYPLTGGGAAQGALDGVLCVQFDNSGSKGEFYEDPGTISTSIFSDDAGDSEFSYHDVIAASTGSGATEGDAFFDKGDRIPVAFSDDDGGTVAAYGGYFMLPAANDAGQCTEASSIEFEVPFTALDKGDYTCAREVTSLEEECATAFGWGRLSNQLLVGTGGGVGPASIYDGEDYVQVEISSIKWRDWDTGFESNFPDIDCGAFYYDGNITTTAHSACALGGEDGGISTPGANATRGCKNALFSACYTIYHNGEGSISAAAVALVLTDIPTGPDGGNNAAASPQQFSVGFSLDETSDASAALAKSQNLGNLVERARSGNPGYRPGLPVLAGVLQSIGDHEYIATGGLRGAGGLELMAGEGRGCGEVGTSPVQFGYDGIGCCVLAFTRDALEQHCKGIGEHVDSTTGFTPMAFHNTSSSVSHVGKYGNADPLDTSQWMELPFSSTSDTTSWDDARGVCSSMVSTLEYRVLYALVGSKANPQSKIVSVDMHFGKSDWVWREQGASEQTFLVCNSVSFKMYGQETQRYKPPSPPVAFTVPWDVFYPFFIPISGETTSAPTPSRVDGTHVAFAALLLPGFSFAVSRFVL